MKSRLFGKESTYLNLSFGERVLVLASLVPTGRVTTYGDLAKAAHGGAMAAQSITAILGRLSRRYPIEIPFHRIVYANGKVWVDDFHRAERMRQYQREGIQLTQQDVVDEFALKRFDFRTVTERQLAERIKHIRGKE